MPAAPQPPLCVNSVCGVYPACPGLVGDLVGVLKTPRFFVRASFSGR
jgi:hypothetical protein